MNLTLSSPNTILSFSHASLSIGDACPLTRFSLAFKKNQATALLGANGSGKSTLLKALVGDPQVRLTSGTLQVLDGTTAEDWSTLEPNARALRGLFMAWQHPPTLLGLKQRVFLRTILNTQRKACGEETLDPFDFLDVVRPCLDRIGLSEQWLDRAVGEGFSGGERKKNELLQMLLLSPHWVLCDEIEAGMDIETLRLTSSLLTEHVQRGGGLLVVSHHAQFLDDLPLQRSVRLRAGGVETDTCGSNVSAEWRR